MVVVSWRVARNVCFGTKIQGFEEVKSMTAGLVTVAVAFGWALAGVVFAQQTRCWFQNDRLLYPCRPLSLTETKMKRGGTTRKWRSELGMRLQLIALPCKVALRYGIHASGGLPMSD